MARLELALLTRILERVGVAAVSSVLLPMQYRPCFLPPPTLMMTSPSRAGCLDRTVAHGPPLPSMWL